jgi:hypothetical protein
VPPTPTVVTAAVTPYPTLDPTTNDMQYAFLINVNDLTSEIEAMAGAPCADLTVETRQNPTEVTEIHGFAATLQRVGSTQAALNDADVKSSLNDLTLALAQLDGALTACGIKPA